MLILVVADNREDIQKKSQNSLKQRNAKQNVEASKVTTAANLTLRPQDFAQMFVIWAPRMKQRETLGLNGGQHASKAF